MKTTTQVKAGGVKQDHNQTSGALKVRSSVKAGGIKYNHNQTSRAIRRNVKAGSKPADPTDTRLVRLSRILP